MIAKTPKLAFGQKLCITVDRSGHSPRVLLLAGFMSNEECNTLISLAKALGMQQSPSYSDTGLEEDRRSESCYFYPCSEHPLISELYARFSKLLNCPVSHLEEIGVVRYSKGGVYDYHFDTHPEMYLEPGGVRLSTCVIYLNSPKRGGATKLETLGLSVYPTPGSLLYFENTYRGVHEETSLHKGDVVTSGEKWILTMWERERPIL